MSTSRRNIASASVANIDRRAIIADRLATLMHRHQDRLQHQVHITQTWLAAASGVRQSDISDLLRGKLTHLATYKITRIALALQLDPEEMMGLIALAAWPAVHPLAIPDHYHYCHYMADIYRYRAPSDDPPDVAALAAAHGLDLTAVTIDPPNLQAWDPRDRHQRDTLMAYAQAVACAIGHPDYIDSPVDYTVDGA